MKNLKLWAGVLAFMALFPCCNSTAVEPSRTAETEALLKNLKRIPEEGIMFGHHDDTVYGIRWDGDPGRSDVKSVCGDYPAVISFDLGHIELGKEKNLDNVSFARLRSEIINQYNRGGMISLSWHLNNPVTGGDSWDVSDATVVEAVLPGGAKHMEFLGWLDNAAAFMNSLVTAEGVKVPVLFRPWHEHTGSWFWWGQKLCTADQYKALWRLTRERMEENGATNLLYAYSPGTEPQDAAGYLERYPGDDVIDLIGFDTYQRDREGFMATLEKSLTILTEVGKAHDKPMAITETGYEAIPDSVWWTETLLPVISKYPISYVLVWRNAREMESHYYAPYPGQTSAADFVKFYEKPETLFANDVKNKLYH